jgi:hypothetical protein
LFGGEGDVVVLGVDEEVRDQCVPDLEGVLGAEQRLPVRIGLLVAG